jgi:vitamin B12 transporter
MLRLNGSTRRYTPPPRGRDLSASATWTYRDGAEVKLFAIDQTSDIGVGIEHPGFSGTFDSDDRTRLAVLTWRDVIGRMTPLVSASHTTQRAEQSFGLFRLTSDLAQTLLFAQADWALHSAATLRAGGDVERLTSGVAGTLPDGDSRSPGAPQTLFAQQRSAVRVGPFVELDWLVGQRTRVITGVRGDHSELTSRWSLDPRVSLAYRPYEYLTLTAAWGIYHQVAAPLQYDSVAGTPGLPSMRASQVVLGMQLGEGSWLWRVEAYEKRYRDLVQLTRTGFAVGDGLGSARGVDVFTRTPLPLGVQLRATFSLLAARRTDPNTGQVTRAPFDISRSETIIAEKRLPSGLRLAAAYRYATGRPYTPVVGATRHPATAEFDPQYGAPMSERLPALRRVDLSTSWYRPLTPHWQGVLYVSVNNVADRDNVQSYTYSSDYSKRIPVRSLFKRSVYFGATLIRQ